ncbi:MAG: TolC family protein [Rubricoccaceae bacterium]
MRAALFAAVFLIASAEGAAQALPPPGAVVTFEEAVRLALARSPQAARAAAAEDARALAVEAARAERLPVVSAQLQPVQNYGLTFDQTTGRLAQQTTEGLSAGLNAQLPLYDGGRRAAAIEQARRERTAAAAARGATAQQIVAQVAEAYLQLARSRALVAVQQEGLAAQQDQMRRVTALVEAGARPRADLIAQRAVVAEREGALVEAEVAAERDEIRVAELAGLDVFASYRFVLPDVDALLASGMLEAPLPAPEALLAAARARRPDLRAEAARIAAAEAALGVARAASRPSVTLFGNAGTGYTSLAQRLADPDAPLPQLPVLLPDGTPILVGGVPFTVPAGSPALERTPFPTQLVDNRSGSLGLSVQIPVFDRFQARRQAEQARVQVTDAQLQREAAERQVAAEIRQALVAARGAAARLRVAEAQVEAARAAVRAEQDRYDFGAGTLYDLAAARTRLAEAEGARAQAALDALYRQVLLRLASGELDPETLGALLGP